MEILTLRDLVKKFGKYELRTNDEIGFDCPKCGPRSGKFHLGVNVRKRLFHCFKCNYKGMLFGQNKMPKPAGLGLNRILKNNIPGFIPLHSLNGMKLHNKSFHYISKRGVSMNEAIRLKWGMSTCDKYMGKLIIPIIEENEVVYFIARSTDGSEPKEISPKKTEGWLPRTEVLYGLDDIPLQAHTLVLVEGIFDSENLKRAGYSSVALLGSHISQVQIGKILAKRPEEIILFFDGDEAGKHGARDALIKIRKRYRGEIKVIKLPDGKDPDQLTKSELESLIHQKEK